MADPKAGGWGPASISNGSKRELGERSGRETGLPLRSTTGFSGISKGSHGCRRGPLLRGGPRDRGAEAAGRAEEAFREGGRCARGCRLARREPAPGIGRPVSERVARDVMRERGLGPPCLGRRRRHGSCAGEVDEAPASLPPRPDGTRGLPASRPNELWVPDITGFRLPGGPREACLSPVVGLSGSRPVAWSVGTGPSAWLAGSSLRAARAALSPGEAPVARAGRGCRYRWPGRESACAEHGPARSTSRGGGAPATPPPGAPSACRGTGSSAAGTGAGPRRMSPRGGPTAGCDAIGRGGRGAAAGAGAGSGRRRTSVGGVRGRPSGRSRKSSAHPSQRI